MSKQVVRVARELPLFFVIFSWLLLMTWRFFTGAHMNGQTYFDTLFFKDASPIHKRRQVAFNTWKRKARVKRMGWRNCIFWPVFWITYGCVVAPWTMFVLAFWASPLYGWLAFIYARKTIFEQRKVGYAEGRVETFWVLKRRFRWLHFGWLRDSEDQPVTAKSESSSDHEDIKIISLKKLLNPGDDAAWAEGISQDDNRT
jgi:hypothetical protein